PAASPTSYDYATSGCRRPAAKKNQAPLGAALTAACHYARGSSASACGARTRLCGDASSAGGGFAFSASGRGESALIFQTSDRKTEAGARFPREFVRPDSAFPGADSPGHHSARSSWSAEGLGTVRSASGILAHGICFRVRNWGYLLSRVATRSVSAPFVRLKIWRRPGAVEPPGGAVVVANHISHFDPFFLSFSFRRVIDWMTTEEFYENPFVAAWLRAVNTFPVNRKRPDRRALRVGVERLRAG